MKRIEEKFATLRTRNEKALIVYLTAGDPSPEITKKLIFALEKAGGIFWKSVFLFPIRQPMGRSFRQLLNAL